MAIATAEDRVRTGRRPAARRLVARDLRSAHGPHRRVDHLGRRLVQREVDVVAGAALQPVPVRHQCRPRGLHRRDLKGQVSRWHQRLPAGQAGPAQHTAHRQQRPVGRHPVAIGAGLTEVRDGQHNQGGVPRPDDVRPEPELGQSARAGRLDPDVGAVQQTQQPVTTVGGGVVGHDAALARVVHGERQADPVVQRRLRPRRAAARRLDPDDVCAEVREEAPAHLAPAFGHVDHPDSIERGRRSSSVRSRSCTCILSAASRARAPPPAAAAPAGRRSAGW